MTIPQYEKRTHGLTAMASKMGKSCWYMCHPSWMKMDNIQMDDMKKIPSAWLPAKYVSFDIRSIFFQFQSSPWTTSRPELSF
jgi:hypothetical protein